jgi:exodeoxyribonuclease VII small subunit
MTISWNEASRELDAIVNSFDSGDVSVDELFEKLTRATELIELLDARLLATKAQVEELSPRLSRLSPDE